MSAECDTTNLTLLLLHVIPEGNRVRERFGETSVRVGTNLVGPARRSLDSIEWPASEREGFDHG